MNHTCKAALIRCIDSRLNRDINSFLELNGLVNDCDIISNAGAAQDIVKHPDGNVMKQLNISVTKHRIQKVIIVHHLDCAAYGGDAAFASAEEQIAKFKEEMNLAKEIILAKFPDLQVELALAKPAAGWWKIEKIA